MNQNLDDKNPVELTQEMIKELKEYVELRVDKAKLSTTEHLSITLSSCYGVLLATFLGVVALIFLSLALMMLLGEVMGYAWAALLVALLYFLLAFLCFHFRARLIANPLIRMFLKMFFKPRN